MSFGPALENNLIVITAPSGAGKTSLIQKLLKRHSHLEFSISHTTRKPREGEKDGLDYFFVSKAKFQSMISEHLFLEWAEVHGNYYGTSKNEIIKKIRSGKKLILDIDVQGSLKLQKEYKAKYIFISVEDLDVLKKRLSKRKTDTSTTIDKRLKNASWEISHIHHWEHVIINTVFDKALDELEKVILLSS